MIWIRRPAWWLVALPGLAIMLTALSLNLLAAWVRTITDPVQRWRWLKVKEVSVNPELVTAEAVERT